MALFLLIDKPEDWTSHDVVGYLRRVTKEKTIGHAGTLDPFATGLLIVGISRPATKQLELFKNLPKVYETELIFGGTSDTQDKTGVITKTLSLSLPPTETVLQEAIRLFTGAQTQIPPMYSAKKIAGKKLYQLAREGKEVVRAPHEITIHSIDLLSYTYPKATLRISCSPGTYIRTLVHDLGQHLKQGAYCNTLRRTEIGPYLVSNATKPQELDKNTWKTQCLDIGDK